MKIKIQKPKINTNTTRARLAALAAGAALAVSPAVRQRDRSDERTDWSGGRRFRLDCWRFRHGRRLRRGREADIRFRMPLAELSH
ncbi:MAG: hypothetical protein LBK99_24495 [Opitutaceae bacterium]|nr:hypothetical protein [Opitutaceae bacterium]